MEEMVLQKIMAVLAFLLAGVAGFGAQAGSFPDHPVTILNIYAPGGGTDLVARSIGQILSEKWKQPVIVVSRPGAGGIIAAHAVASSPRDGYTLLITDVSYSIAPSVHAHLQYDPIKDLQPISLLNTVEQVLVVNSSLPFNTLQDLVAFARAYPGKLTFASAGVGTPNHLIPEELCARAGIKITHVPYKGAVPALTDVVAGHSDIYIGAISTAAPFIKDGRLKALAVMQKERSSFLPDVPPIAELGYKEVNAGSYYGIFAPAGTPNDVVAKLSRDISAALATPEVKRTIASLGGRIIDGGPEEFGRFLQQDIQKWHQAAKAANVVPQ
jgi:tripartite-type tricarboxylate transporter receptor subunit TctC